MRQQPHMYQVDRLYQQQPRPLARLDGAQPLTQVEGAGAVDGAPADNLVKREVRSSLMQQPQLSDHTKVVRGGEAVSAGNDMAGYFMQHGNRWHYS